MYIIILHGNFRVICFSNGKSNSNQNTGKNFAAKYISAFPRMTIYQCIIQCIQRRFIFFTVYVGMNFPVIMLAQRELIKYINRITSLIKILYSFISQLKMLKDDDFSLGFKTDLIIKYVTYFTDDYLWSPKRERQKTERFG